ncbi:hypothetical protein QYE76_006815 [Lolium multiflorum]|uniref:F-box domain-containing protein n=1 Tax=Lolium multiflorum TaxID=4521 RepID=A0AAD8RWC8_LOLMU|nr:hypothetical protein QYE76_006815 [Lolium multiflorum]
MPRRVSNNQVTAADAKAAAAVFASRDVVASILVRLPASVLRRFCTVCKRWRDIISDPVFIKAHMVHGSHAPTHTVVFVYSSKGCAGSGFLFDELWRLTARFIVGESEAMIGTCNGLLCFHDRLQKIIRVVEPFTGEATNLPLPTDSSWSNVALSYCFAFDATAGQYKIIHKHIANDHANIGNYTMSIKLFTIGQDKDWRTVNTAYVSFSYLSFSYTSFIELACNSRAVYWSYMEPHHKILMYARLDLATEVITSVECPLVNKRPIFCHHPAWQNGDPCIIGIRLLTYDESENGCCSWPSDMDAMAHDVDAVMTLPHGLRIPRQQALQRGHLLLQKRNGALYAHKILSRSTNDLDIGSEQLLIGIGVEEPAKSSSSGQFVAVQGSQSSGVRQAATYSGMMDISTFAYVPTVCSAPLALYFGTTMQ